MTTATHTPTRVRPERVVGATAIALAASLLIQNVVLGAGAPDYGAPIADVLAFHAKNRGTVAVSVGLEALNLPLLLGFLAGLHGLVRGRSEGGATWSRLGLAAGATLSAIWAIYAVAWIGVVLAAGRGAESIPTLQLAWHMHAAGLAMALPALGTTFFGAAMATHAALLTAPWQRLLGAVGPILLIVAGSASLAIANGSPMVFVGVGGLALWVVWLLATGIRLMRVKATTLVRP